jgi:hypothetical protein
MKMPEILGLVARAKGIEELEQMLEEMQFEPVSRGDLDPTIRRMCEHSLPRDQMDFVMELSGKKKPFQFGIVTNKSGVREYCGIDREKLEIRIANHDAVEKRRRRYTADPLPEEPLDQGRFLELLIFEVIDRWCGSDETSPGAPLWRIVSHVADYANIETKHARKLVDRQLPIMNILEKREVDGEERWRIKPSLLPALRS